LPEVFKKVIVWDYISIFRFPYFEDGLVFTGGSKYIPRYINPLFVDFFFFNDYDFSLPFELTYPTNQEIIFYDFLNWSHIYHFDFFYDPDLVLKYVYNVVFWII
jgi:hypothetical protein